MKQNYKKAFTLMELIMVIVIMSIILGTALMNFRTAVEITDVEHSELYHDLQFVKQLNLNQSFFDPNDANWKNKTDCFQLNNIHSYQLDNNASGILSSIQTMQGNYLKSDLKSDIIIKDSSNNNINRICFDNLGRVYKTNLDLSNLMHENINITVMSYTKDYNLTISITPITGLIQ